MCKHSLSSTYYFPFFFAQEKRFRGYPCFPPPCGTLLCHVGVAAIATSHAYIGAS